MGVDCARARVLRGASGKQLIIRETHDEIALFARIDNYTVLAFHLQFVMPEPMSLPVVGWRNSICGQDGQPDPTHSRC